MRKPLLECDGCATAAVVAAVFVNSCEGKCQERHFSGISLFCLVGFDFYFCSYCFCHDLWNCLLDQNAQKCFKKSSFFFLSLTQLKEYNIKDIIKKRCKSFFLSNWISDGFI